MLVHFLLKYRMLLALAVWFLPHSILAQNIISSEINSRDNSSIQFEILGRFGGNIFIYKNISREHYLAKYDDSMRIVETIQLDFIPEKVFNLDFVTYPEKCFIIYQYQKNNIVFCKAVKFYLNGDKSYEDRILDTTSIGYFADNKIYSTTFSEDKKKILVYKENIKNESITVATKLFDENLNQLDSTRQFYPYNDRKELYSRISVDNQGNFVFAKSTENFKGKDGMIDIFIHQFQSDSIISRQLILPKKYSDDIFIKADNLNKKFVLCSFCYTNRKRYVDGLLAASLRIDSVDFFNYSYSSFSDTLRNIKNADYKYLFDYSNLAIQNLVLKKNGEMVLFAEDYNSENMGFNNNWNRGDFNTTPFYNLQGNYLLNPYYGYIPFNSSGLNQSIRYFGNDIVFAGIDNAHKIKWNTIIRKKQEDIDNQNFLSYSTVNSGNEIKVLFLERDRTRQIISCQGLLPDGELNRYPTLKATDNRFEFMPRLAKQIGSSVVIMPFIYLGKIGFSKIQF